MDDKEFGELIGTVKSIKENTDKIPDISVKLALHEARISAMEPKVDRHETTAQRAIAVSGLFGIIAGIISSMIKGYNH